MKVVHFLSIIDRKVVQHVNVPYQISKLLVIKNNKHMIDYVCYRWKKIKTNLLS